MKSVKASDDAITQEIEIRRPAERIFDALIRPEELLKWWRAAGKFEVTKVESDLRPGGKWRMHVHSASRNAVLTVAGEYRAIERPHLLAFTWIREQEDKTETLVEWSLEETDGVTRVRVTHSGLNTEALRDRNSGWPLIVTLLKAHIEEAQ
jgi:uncharacterized protein YndB with AHSA1/START domain